MAREVGRRSFCDTDEGLYSASGLRIGTAAVATASTAVVRSVCRGTRRMTLVASRLDVYEPMPGNSQISVFRQLLTDVVALSVATQFTAIRDVQGTMHWSQFFASGATRSPTGDGPGRDAS